MKARKGDLILVERTTSNHYSVAAMREAKAEGRTLEAISTRYHYGVVASATREGIAKSWYQVGYGEELVSEYAEPLTQKWGLALRTWVMSRKDIDVEAVLRAAKANHWPGHPGQPMPFDTYEEACSVARPFVKEKDQLKKVVP